MTGWLILGAGSAIFLMSVIYGVVLLLYGRGFFKKKDKAVSRERMPAARFEDKRLVPVAVAYLQQSPFVKEHSMNNKMVFWDKPSIDALLYVLDIKATLREIKGDDRASKVKGLRAMKLGELKNFYIDHRLPDQPPEKTRRELSHFFHSDSGGAAQRPDLWESTTAINNALQIIMQLTYYTGFDVDQAGQRQDTIEMVWKEFGPWLEGCYNKVLHNMCNNTGVIGDVSWEEPKIAVNYLGWESFRKLGRVNEVISSKDINWLEFQSWFTKHLQSGERWQAFTDEIGGEPVVCASHHALSTITRLPEEYKIRLVDNLDFDQFIYFVNSCWAQTDDIGGYSWTPGEEPTVIHTRYALGMVRSIKSCKAKISRAKFPVQPDKILRFLHAVWGPAGFSLVPNTTPSLYATRAAVLTLKYLEIFRIHGIFTEGREYCNLRDSLIDKIAGAMERMLEGYFDSKRNGYMGFPVYEQALHVF